MRRAKQRTLVVVRGVDSRVGRQAEHLRVHVVVQRARVPLLEVGAPAAAHQQSIAREHRAAGQHEAHAAASVARRGANLQLERAER